MPASLKKIVHRFFYQNLVSMEQFLCSWVYSRCLPQAGGGGGGGRLSLDQIGMCYRCLKFTTLFRSRKKKQEIYPVLEPRTYCIVLYCIVSYCVVLCRMVSYCLVWCRVVSYRVVSYPLDQNQLSRSCHSSPST